MLKRIVIVVDDWTRLIVLPEGGLRCESYVDGIGWTLDDEGYDDVPHDVIEQAAALLSSVAAKVS